MKVATNMKAIIYTRVSTKDQDAMNQITELEAYAAKQGWKVLEIITDKLSGTKAAKDRPGLGKVLKLAAQKKFDVLLFWSLDRLSREGTRETLGYLQTLSDQGVKWHSYTEEYLSSLGVFADVVISILSTLAKQERIRISERTKAGMKRAIAEGSIVGRPKGKQMQRTTDRIKQVKELRGEGHSFTRIGKQLGISKQRAAQLFQMA
jgi:DNA invertase Pin-like site-specific DNA recombinase